jgi:site-specific DNA-methyltransferase (adenine-specific)
LKKWENNPAEISKEAAGRLVECFNEFGQIETLAVDPENRLIDGHQRLDTWLAKYGDIEVDCRKASRLLTEKERQKIAVMLRSGAVGRYNWDVVSSWAADDLQGWGMDSATLKEWKHDVSALDNLIESEKKEPVDAEPQIDRAAELNEKWQVKTGDLWQIGEHRLLCGDSTNKDSKELLLGNDFISMIQIDPPYGVNYGGQKDSMFYGKDTAGKPREKIVSDNSIVDAMELLDDCLSLYSAPIMFIWHAPQFSFDTRQIIEAHNIDVFSVIVWNKNHANFGAMGATYKPKYEMAFACKLDKIPFYGPDNEVTVWDCDRSSKNEFHPTQKPVELFERAITNHTKIDEIVLDFFAGSGTSLVACENLHRKCRAIEISPNYCAVILERMATAFPELEIKKL